MNKGEIMTIDEVHNYFGSDGKACKALGQSRQAFTHWRIKGYIPPLQQLRFEQVTNGDLKADIVKPIRQKHNEINQGQDNEQANNS